MALRLDRLRRQPLAASNRREHLCGDRGFSLAEVLVATLIFVGGIVAVAHLMVVAVQLHLLGKHTAEAAILASTKVEELTRLNFATAPAIQVSPASPDPVTTNVANYFDLSGNGFTRRWRVDNGPNANTRLVTVRVVPPVVDRRLYKEVEVTTILRR
jgi:hypothetical protein